ncbi:MAG: hypothetical protein ABJN36_10950 [Cyclobacteriaceae bacterium]
MKNLLILSITLIFAFACKTSQKGGLTLEEVKKSLQTEENDEIICDGNESQTFELCQTNLNDSQVDALRKFLIYEKSSGKVVLEKSVVGGYVKWVDDTKVEFYTVPGIIKDGQSKNDFIKIYDVATGQTVGKTTPM